VASAAPMQAAPRSPDLVAPANASRFCSDFAIQSEEFARRCGVRTDARPPALAGWPRADPTTLPRTHGIEN